LQELITVISFVMSVLGGLVVMFHKEKDKQTMGAIVAGAFLISFFINMNEKNTLVLQAACSVAFAMAVTGGLVAMFANREHRRTGATVTGIVALGTSLLILFVYLHFSPS